MHVYTFQNWSSPSMERIFTIATLSIMQHTSQLIAHINYLTFKALQYSKWNLWGRKFCSNFAQRETLTNVHPAAAEAPKLRRCSVQSFCNILLLGHHHQPPVEHATCAENWHFSELLCSALLCWLSFCLIAESQISSQRLWRKMPISRSQFHVDKCN